MAASKSFHGTPKPLTGGARDPDANQKARADSWCLGQDKSTWRTSFLHCWFGEPPRYSPDPRALQLLMPDAPEEVADPEQWLFLDTETTGLAGGTGTYAFLVGLAWWEGGGLESRAIVHARIQRGALVAFALAERIAERPVLVTFNGKSFRLAVA